jgi:hypothetical protein
MAEIQQYRNMLRINRHRLDDELEIQAELMDRISQQVNRLNSRMLEAKEQLLREEARLMEDISENASSKMTVAQLEAAVRRHPDRKSAWSAYDRARYEFDEWEALRDAWKQRGFSIKTLADLYTSHYFTVADYQANDRKDRDMTRISKHQADHQERRAAMHEVRASKREQEDQEPRPRRRMLTER